MSCDASILAGRGSPEALQLPPSEQKPRPPHTKGARHHERDTLSGPEGPAAAWPWREGETVVSPGRARRAPARETRAGPRRPRPPLLRNQTYFQEFRLRFGEWRGGCA